MNDQPITSVHIGDVPGLSNQIAHVLRTPLSLILLELGQIEDPRARKLEERLEDYNRLLQSFLSLAAVTEAVAREPGNFDLSLLVGEACDANTELAASRGVTIQREIEPEISVFGHRDAAFFCVLNIVENALIHGGAVRRIEVRLDRSGRITVADDGNGIQLSPAERAFEPFARGEGRHSVGLGLTTARVAINAHRGACHIEQSALGGCAVHVDFGAAVVVRP